MNIRKTDKTGAKSQQDNKIKKRSDRHFEKRKIMRLLLTNVKAANIMNLQLLALQEQELVITRAN